MTRSPDQARIKKLEERNEDLRGAIESVRDLLEPHDIRDDDRVIELTERQRERLDEVKEECADDNLPETTDEQAMKALMDTWDAVDDGLYSEGL